MSRMPGVPTENTTLDDPEQQPRLRAACAGRSGIVTIACGNVPTAALALKAGIRGVVQIPVQLLKWTNRSYKFLVLQLVSRTGVVQW
jgi:hypothetical protein